MNDERVLLTSKENPIYHDPSPNDPRLREMQDRWKGKVLLEFYETGVYRSFDGSKDHRELARYIVVWDSAQEEPRIFIDGMWCDEEGTVQMDAVLAPGTTEEIRESFRKWAKDNPHVMFGKETLDIDRQVQVIPTEGSVEKAREEIGSLFTDFMHGTESTK